MAQWNERRLDDKRFHGSVRQDICTQSLVGMGDKEETCFCGLSAIPNDTWCDLCKGIPTKNSTEYCLVGVESQSQRLSSYNHPRISVIIPKDYYVRKALLML